MTTDPAPFPPCAGVVLAGGRSSRMGREKALLPFHGCPLWRHQRETLIAVGADPVVVSVRPDQTWLPAEVRRVIDVTPDQGPLGGLAAAFLQVPAGTALLALAIDLPRVSPAWFRRLMSVVDPDHGTGAVGVHPEGIFEPLAALYPAAFAERARRAIDRGELALQPLVGNAVVSGLIRAVRIEPEERAWFENWNQPGDVTES